MRGFEVLQDLQCRGRQGKNMHYDSVLAYVRKILENSHIPTFLYEEPFTDVPTIDFGLRESLFANFNKEETFAHFERLCKEHTLYYITDKYYCSYVCMRLPDPEKKQFFIAGPFTFLDINQKNYLELLENLDLPADLLPLLKNYYYNISFVHSESDFRNLIGTLAETIYQGSSNYTISHVHGNLWNSSLLNDYITNPGKGNLMPVTTMAIEEKYRLENQCMQAVSQGNYNLIDQLFSRSNGIRPIPRLTNALRDYKNYMVIFNTLLRKAAEQGAVHPVYLDELSSRFAKKIEGLTSVDAHSLEQEMLHKYCLLVRNHSVKGYSPVIQKTLNQISLDLTGDLSLKNLSEKFCISAGYLSTLFKKEVGMTLTDYVNKKRIDHAILLLNATNLQIQTIASYCGINDINYFMRTFKKLKGMTPKKYREMIAKPF